MTQRMRKELSETLIVAILRMLEAGSQISEVISHSEVSQSTFHRWRRRYPEFDKRVKAAIRHCVLKSDKPLRIFKGVPKTHVEVMARARLLRKTRSVRYSDNLD